MFKVKLIKEKNIKTMHSTEKLLCNYFHSEIASKFHKYFQRNGK